MCKPAARIGDMHVCPMVTPGVPPIPHVGGPIIGPGMPTVLIGNMPAATLGDMCTCVGPPSTIVLGSMGVLIGGKPAARMGDLCAHGGTIVMGMPTVLIGEMSPGAPGAPVVAGLLGVIGKGMNAVIEFLEGGLDALAPDSPMGSAAAAAAQGAGQGITGALGQGLARVMSEGIGAMINGLMPGQPEVARKATRIMNMTNAMNAAAAGGTGFVEECGK